MRTLALVALVLLCACGPSIQSAASEGVTLRVEPATISPGGSATLLLSNQSAAAVGYNLCGSALETQVGGSWQPVPSDRVCTMELRSLAPGEEVRYPIALPRDLSAGTYRFVTNIEAPDPAGASAPASPSFHVR